MPTFKLEKGSKFALDKGITEIQIGLGWDPQDGVDLDGSVMGLVHLPGGQAQFYGDGSHAVGYFNTDLKTKEGRFVTSDGSIVHSGDAREGGGGDEPDEIIDVDFAKLPKTVVELSVWITIYHALKKKQTFSNVHHSYFQITDKSNPGAPLCKYDLGKEFANSTAIQVGSFVRGDQGVWEFTALGAGSGVELDKIVEQYS